MLSRAIHPPGAQHARAPRVGLLTLVGLIGLLSAPALRAESPATLAEAKDAPVVEVTRRDPEATLEVWNRPIVTFRVGLGARTAPAEPSAEAKPAGTLEASS
jgi:hypothetical protein